MTKAVSALRQRMIDDMKIRNMSPNTQYIYTRAVANFSSFHQQSPDKLTIEDVRDYRLHLLARGLKAASINPIMGALRFFYGTTLGQKQFAEQITFARKEDRLPAVLTRDEVVTFLKAVGDLKMRTAFITIYAAGLRVSEVVALTAADIDSKGMSSACVRARGVKIAMSCCRSSCSPSCATIGVARAHRCGCFPAPIPPRRSRLAPCSGHAARRPMPPVSTSR
jgi:integrase/recombinase XerD